MERDGKAVGARARTRDRAINGGEKDIKMDLTFLFYPIFFYFIPFFFLLLQPNFVAEDKQQ